MHHRSPVTTACIEACTSCYQTCMDSAMTHCLEAGGKHVEAKHFRLMMACAEICRSSAHLMLINSDHARALCKVCADICDQCAADCIKMGDMKNCADACKRCADACRKMAG